MVKKKEIFDQRSEPCCGVHVILRFGCSLLLSHCNFCCCYRQAAHLNPIYHLVLTNMCRCTYPECERPEYSTPFRQITPGKMAGGRDWSELVGMVLCTTCYDRYRRKGTLDKNAVGTPRRWGPSVVVRGSILSDMLGQRQHEPIDRLASHPTGCGPRSGANMTCISAVTLSGLLEGGAVLCSELKMDLLTQKIHYRLYKNWALEDGDLANVPSRTSRGDKKLAHKVHPHPWLILALRLVLIPLGHTQNYAQEPGNLEFGRCVKTPHLVSC